MSIFLLRYSIWTAVTDYRKHLWRDILVDVWPLVLSPPVLCLNLAKSATLCPFVQSEGADKTAVYPIFAGEQRKEINKWDNLQLCPDAGKGCCQFQLNIKQRDLNKQLLSRSSSKCECYKYRMTTRHNEGPGTAMNDRERPWMAMNDSEWSQMAQSIR